MCHKSSIFLAPLRGGSARRRWGRELAETRSFERRQGSLPPPLRSTSIAEGGKKKEPRGALFLHQCAKTVFFIFLYTAFAASGRTRPAAV